MRFKVSEICKINEISINKTDNYEFINYLDTSNLTEGRIDEVQLLEMKVDKIPSRAKRKIKKKDILISTVRPNQKHYGIINNLVDNLIASTGFAVLSANEEIVDSEYLYSYLTQESITNYLQAIAEASTSTYPSIKPSVIGELELELPSLPEQKAIAHTLSTLVEKIEVNNQISKTLENMARAIFQHWFVDFEFPNEDGELYKSSGGKMVESELGKIPEGWEIKEINDISSTISKGTTPKSKDINSATDKKEIYFIKVKDIQTDGYINFNNVEKIPKSVHLNILKRSILKEKDILLSIAGTIGRISYISDVYNGVNSNQAIAFIRLKDSGKYFNFLLYFMKSSLFQNEISSKIVQAVQANVSLSVIKAIRLVLPNDSNLKKFNELIQPIVTKIEMLRNENESLIGIRESLLPKLLSGEIEL